MRSTAVRQAAGRALAAPPVYRDPSPGFVDGDTLKAVFEELRRQHDTFGQQDLNLFDWASILGEEYGEVCRAVNELHFGSAAGVEPFRALYGELVQVAAVALHAARIVAANVDVREAPNA